MEEARKRRIDEVLEFPQILKELIDMVEVKPSYDSETLQTIRLLKKYGFLKS